MSEPEIDPTDELASLLEDLHDSEINGEIGWFYDGVWRVKLGAAEHNCGSLGQAAKWLRQKEIEIYPDSAYRRGSSAEREGRC